MTLARYLADACVGSNITAKMAMTAVTTSNSIKANAWFLVPEFLSVKIDIGRIPSFLGYLAEYFKSILSQSQMHG
jgi:hypothetical protein